MTTIAHSAQLTANGEGPAHHDQVPPLVLSLREGDRSMADLLGGKGANLAEMTRIGLPVPRGFVITTEACRTFLHTGSEPAPLAGRRRGAAGGRGARTPAGCSATRTGPLLVSVRSGARFSMPGMMETILNVGLTDDVRRWPGAPRQRAVRLGLLPASGPDVRPHRPGRRRRPVLRPARAGTDLRRGSQRLRARRTRPAGAHRRVPRSCASPAPARTCRRTPVSSCAGRSWPSSSRGAATAPVSTGSTSTSATTSGRRSASSRWSTGTPVSRAAAGCASPATRRPVRAASTATT